MHLIVFPLYVLISFLFYLPLLGHNMLPDRPRPVIRLVSLGLMMVPETMLGMVIHFTPFVLYPSYEASALALGADPLADQKFAGALAWALTMVIDGLWAMLAAWEWFRDEERQVTREEAIHA
jgi:cytochrome c oxidase assembly factor CtaG